MLYEEHQALSAQAQIRAVDRGQHYPNDTQAEALASFIAWSGHHRGHRRRHPRHSGTLLSQGRMPVAYRLLATSNHPCSASRGAGIRRRLFAPARCRPACHRRPAAPPPAAHRYGPVALLVPGPAYWALAAAQRSATPRSATPAFVFPSSSSSLRQQRATVRLVPRSVMSHYWHRCRGCLCARCCCPGSAEREMPARNSLAPVGTSRLQLSSTALVQTGHSPG